MPRARKPPRAPGGNAKAQRHDLVMPAQAPAAPTNMEYGSHNDSIAAQRALPVAGSPPPPAPGGAGPAAGPPGAGGGFAGALAAAMAHPASADALDAPTNRPDEPLSQGAPFGPGAGPEKLGLPSAGEDIALKMHLLYQQYELPEIAELLTEMQ